MELTAVMAIIIIVALVSWGAINPLKRKTQVDNACNEALSWVNKTRNYSLAGKMVNGVVPTAFQIVFTLNSSNIKITDNAVPANTLESFDLPSGVVVTSATATSYTFPAPQANTLNPAMTPSGSIYFNFPGGGSETEKALNALPYRAACQ